MLNIPLMDNNIIDEDVDALITFLRHTDRFTQGPKVQEFESAWSQWLGVQYSVFVNSGASANLITMCVLRELYGPGEVLVPTITWSSDIISVITAGLTPVFVDVSFHTLAMQEDEILKKITPKTRAVFLTHVLGHNGLTPKILKELKRRNIILIEDVCESHGALYTHENGQRQKCGTLGLASNFSFYYAHHMSTIEGGMICTDNYEFYQYAKMFRSHGMVRECDAKFREKFERAYPELHPEFLFPVAGFNMRSTELNAVIGLNQLKRLDEQIVCRRENYQYFLSQLDGEKYFTEFLQEGNSNYAFVLLLKQANTENFQRLITMLKAENVEYRRGTAGGGNQARQPFVRKAILHINPSDYVNAEMIHKFGVYIGNYPTLSRKKIFTLCQRLNSIF